VRPTGLIFKISFLRILDLMEAL
jgi:hypothetical protein